MQKNLFTILCTLLLSFLFFTSRAQIDYKKNNISIGGGVQWGNGLGLRPAFYAGYERRFSFHSGIETGIHYLNLNVNTLAISTPNTAKKEQYHLFSLPILYKLHTNILDIAAGPSLNLLSASASGSTSLVHFKKDPGQFAIGYTLKISKEIPLSEHLSLVPEAGIQGNQYFKKPQAGVNTGLKLGF